MAAWQLPDGTTGMTLASAMRRPSTPRTLSWGSTTAMSSEPILQEPAWWWYESAAAVTKPRTRVGAGAVGPGHDLLLDEVRHRLGGEDSAGQLDAVGQAVEVGRVAQVVGVHQRHVDRVGAGQPDRRRATWAGRRPGRMTTAPGRPGHDVDERDLDVGPDVVGVRLGRTGRPRTRSASAAGSSSAVSWITGASTWLWKFSPTPGRSTCTSMPTSLQVGRAGRCPRASAAWATRAPRRRR